MPFRLFTKDPLQLALMFCHNLFPSIKVLVGFINVLCIHVCDEPFNTHLFLLNCVTRTGFEQAVQAYAIHVLSLTYKRVPRTVLAEVLILSLEVTFQVRFS